MGEDKLPKQVITCAIGRKKGKRCRPETTWTYGIRRMMGKRELADEE